jgi:hypothetical protein
MNSGLKLSRKLDLCAELNVGQETPGEPCFLRVHGYI